MKTTEVETDSVVRLMVGQKAVIFLLFYSLSSLVK